MDDLGEYQKRREIVAVTASRWPRAWSEAATVLLERSHTEIQADIRHGTKFEATDARARQKALARVEALLETPEDAKITLPPLDEEDERSFDRAMLELQRVLCPKGWRDKMLPFFLKAQKDALDLFYENGTDEDLYFYRELSGLIDRFEQVEQDGIRAAANLAREMQVQEIA